jgi:hypothetical protein
MQARQARVGGHVDAVLRAEACHGVVAPVRVRFHLQRTERLARVRQQRLQLLRREVAHADGAHEPQVHHALQRKVS